MLRSSLDAIRATLTKTFDTGPIYVNNVPEEFKRPSFFVQMASSSEDNLTFTKYQSRTVWQIVYFPKWDEAGNRDNFELLVAADKIRDAFMASPSLTAPDGTVYHVIDVEGGPRDQEVFMRVTLETQSERARPSYENMQDITITEV